VKAPQHKQCSTWTGEEVAYLHKRCDDGASDAEIAKEMGTTPSAIKGARATAGLPSNRTGRPQRINWTKDMDDTLLRMRSLDERWVDIGDALGLKDDACRSRYNRLKAKGLAPESYTEDDLPFLADISAPTPEEHRRAFDAEMLRAENAARAAEYRRVLKRSAPPADWQPGDPATW